MTSIEDLARRGAVVIPKKSIGEGAKGAAIKGAFGSSFGGVSMKDLNRKTAVFVSVLFGSAWAITFVCLLWSMTISTMSQKFLALTTDDADSACSEVPLASKGMFEASYTGLWDTDPKFTRNTSILELSLTGKKLTNLQFSQGLTRVKEYFVRMGRRATQRNVLYSLVVWTSFVIRDDESGMVLTSSSDSGIVFQGQAFQAAMSSAAGVCDARITTGASLSSRFDIPAASIVMRLKLVTSNASATTAAEAATAAVGEKKTTPLSTSTSTSPPPRTKTGPGSNVPTPPTGSIQVHRTLQASPATPQAPNKTGGGRRYDENGVRTSARQQARSQQRFIQPCPRQGLWVTPDTLQISPSVSQFRSGYLEYYFDVRSVTLAIALNYGILKTSKFVRQEDSFGARIGLVAYFDPWYKNPPMQPVYCLDKSNPRLQSMYGITLDSVAMNGPEICLVASSFNTRTMFFFVPMLHQFYNNGLHRLFDGFMSLTDCLCPGNAQEKSCNLEKYFFSMFYDTAFSLKQTLAFAVRNQRIVASSEDGDILLSKDLSKIVAYTSIIDGSREVADRPIVSFLDTKNGNVWADRSSYRNMSLNQWLRLEYNRVWPTSSLSAFVFQLNRYPGQTDVILPMNRYKVTISRLAVGQFENQDQQQQQQQQQQPTPSAPAATAPSSDQFDFKIEWSRAAGRNPAEVEPLIIQFPRIMCVDTFQQTAKGLSRLSEIAPVPLVENYYSCQKLLRGALLSSVGNAAASASLYIGLVWAIAGILYVIVLRHCQSRSRTGQQQQQSSELVLTEDVREVLEKGLQDLRDDALFSVIASLHASAMQQQQQQQGKEVSPVSSVMGGEAFEAFARLFRRKRRASGANGASTDEEEDHRDCLIVGQALSAQLDSEEKLEHCKQGQGQGQGQAWPKTNPSHLVTQPYLRRSSSSSSSNNEFYGETDYNLGLGHLGVTNGQRRMIRLSFSRGKNAPMQQQQQQQQHHHHHQHQDERPMSSSDSVSSVPSVTSVARSLLAAPSLAGSVAFSRHPLETPRPNGRASVRPVAPQHSQL